MHTKSERTCIACKLKFQQNKMLRIAKSNNGVEIDFNKKLQGRGAYICKNNECIANVVKKKLLNRAFKTNLENTIYECLGDYEKNN